MIAGVAYQRIIDALESHGNQTKAERAPGQARAMCPAHGVNSKTSLKVTGVDGQVLVHCFGGCTPDDVLASLNLHKADLYDSPKGKRYDYTDYQGTILRSVFRTPDKQFRQTGDKSSTVLYRLPEIVEAVADHRTVYLVEGEKDADTITAFGAVATTSPQGSDSWPKVDPSPLFGAKVIVVVDGDAPGEKFARAVKESLDGQVQSLTFVHAREGKDAADHLAAGHGLEDFDPFDLEDVPDPRRVRITWASDIEPEPVVWAWSDPEGRIPAGALVVAAGREGTGKSSFGIWMAAQITLGTLPGHYFGTPRKVFYVAVEDSWKHTLVPRLMTAGADLSKIGRFDVLTAEGDEITLSLPLDNWMLERSMKAHNVALTVIDPLMSVIGERIDTHKEREVRSALDPIAKMADRTGSVILGIAHFNKGSSTDAASLITGSGAFKNVPRAVFGFARDETEDSTERIMTQVKNSLGRDDLPSLSYKIESAEVETKSGIAITGKFIWTGESDRSVQDVLRASRVGAEDDAEDRNACQTFVTEYIKNSGLGGEAPANDIIKAGRVAGFSEMDVKNARKRSRDPKIETRKSGFNRGWVWAIANDKTNTVAEGDDPEGVAEGVKGVRDQRVTPTTPSVTPTPDKPNNPDLFGEPRWPKCACGNDIYSGNPECGKCTTQRAKAAS